MDPLTLCFRIKLLKSKGTHKFASACEEANLSVICYQTILSAQPKGISPCLRWAGLCSLSPHWARRRSHKTLVYRQRPSLSDASFESGKPCRWCCDLTGKNRFTKRLAGVFLVLLRSWTRIYFAEFHTCTIWSVK